MRPASRLFCTPPFLLHFPAQAQWHPISDVSAVQSFPNGVELSAGAAHVRIVALSPNVVRLRYAEQGTFPTDESFAVLANAFRTLPTSRSGTPRRQ